jgi:hypothetical protein
MQIIEYAKSHPLATGAIVVIGGILFIVIVRGGGDSSGASGATGPSDAEIAAQTALGVAQINAQASAASAGAAVNAASIGAGVQLNSDNKAAEVAMRQIEAARELGLAQITAEKGALDSAIAASSAQQTAKTNAIMSSLSKLKKKNRDDVLQAYITGEQYHGQGTSSTAQTIGAIGYAAGNIGKALAGFL